MSREGLWVALLAMALVTYALRASFLLLGERLRLPRGLERALVFVPAAVLAAIAVPAVLAGEGGGPDLPRLAAATVAVGVAWRTKSLAGTIATGMVVLWTLRAVLG